MSHFNRDLEPLLVGECCKGNSKHKSAVKCCIGIISYVHQVAHYAHSNVRPYPAGTGVWRRIDTTSSFTLRLLPLYRMRRIGSCCMVIC
jgi:hypothetical protein